MDGVVMASLACVIYWGTELCCVILRLHITDTVVKVFLAKLTLCYKCLLCFRSGFHAVQVLQIRKLQSGDPSESSLPSSRTRCTLTLHSHRLMYMYLKHLEHYNHTSQDHTQQWKFMKIQHFNVNCVILKRFAVEKKVLEPSQTSFKEQRNWHNVPF